MKRNPRSMMKSLTSMNERISIIDTLHDPTSDDKIDQRE